MLTLGDKGAYYADTSERLFRPAMKTTVVDSTAAGDTFTGYFFCAILEGKPVEEALRLATAASAIAVGREGAGVSIPLRAEVEMWIKNV